MNQLEKLALPTQTTKMILWTMGQDKSFESSPLFEEITAIVGLSGEQINRIGDRRQTIKEITTKIRESLLLIRRLKTSIESRNSRLDNQLTAIRQIATTRQTIQLLFWITKNASKVQSLLA